MRSSGVTRPHAHPVHRVLGHDRSANAAAPGPPSHSRQLPYALASDGEDVARRAPVGSFPLHPDRRLLVEASAWARSAARQLLSPPFDATWANATKMPVPSFGPPRPP